MRAIPCKACGAEIVFLRTAAGKLMPVDAETVSPEDTEYEPESGHVSHFKTCPKANEF